MILGAAGGRGVGLATIPKTGAPPAFYGMGSGSLGLQIGAKVSEIVFIFRTEKGLNAILDHKFMFGAEAGVTLVAVGIGRRAPQRLRSAPTSSPSRIPSACSPEPRSKSPTRRRHDWNALYYGNGATTKAIVLDRRFNNPGAEPIRQYLAKW